MAQLISLYRLVCFACCCCSLFCFLPSVLSAPRSSSSYDGNGGKWRCGEEAKKEVDEMVARIMTFGRQDRKFPVNKAQFKPYCKEQLNMIARLEDYKSSCLKDRSKQTVAIIIYSMKNVVGTYCRNPNSKRTTELINSASCANEATTEYARCNSEYIDLLLAVENSKDAKQQLVQLCCGYVEVFKCIRSSAASLAGCTESQVEANVNYIRGFFDNASNLICSDYSAESDKCDRVKLLKRKGVRPPPANSNSWPQSSFSRPQSYFNPLVHLLSSL